MSHCSKNNCWTGVYWYILNRTTASETTRRRTGGSTVQYSTVQYGTARYGAVRYGTVRNFISIFFTCKFQVHSRTTGCSSKLYSTYSDFSRSNSRTIGCSSKLYSIYLDCSRSNSRTTGCSSKLLYHCKGAEDPLFLDEGQ